MSTESQPPEIPSLAAGLAALFTPHEVQVELRPALAAQPNTHDFPWPNEDQSPSRYFAELVAALERRGMVDREFFDVLVKLRPRREAYIREIPQDADRRGGSEARARRSAAPLQQVLGGRYALLACERARPLTTDWKAQDQEDGSFVTITTLNHEVLDDRSVRARFTEQGRRILAIDHPSLPRTIHLSDGDDEPPFLVSEWISGTTLRERATALSSSPGLDAPWLAALDAIGGALAALHAVGLTHFYLQPDTILRDASGVWRLTAIGPLPEPRRAPAADAAPSLCPVDRRYASPEEHAGTAHDVCDARADIYSLALIALLIQTGREPPRASSYGVLRSAWNNIQRARPMLSSSPGLRSAFGRALHDVVAKRHDTVREFVLELHQESDPPASRPAEERRVSAVASPVPAAPGVTDAAVFAGVVNDLFALAHLMHASRREAIESLLGFAADEARLLALPAAPSPRDALIAGFARVLEEKLGRKTEYAFQILDDLLREDVTSPIDINVEEIDGDPRRVHPLLWELKRTCLIAVLGCLPPGVRIAFILTEMFGYSPAAAADLLGITEAAYRVRLTRARKRMENYLTPRCQHVDAQNPCHCEGRLMCALEKKFVAFPAHLHEIPHTPHVTPVEHRDTGSLYRSLPPSFLAGEEYAQVLKVASDTRASRG